MKKKVRRLDNNYYDALKDIYSCSAIKTIITDENFNICWINDAESEELFVNKSALCVFEAGTKIPTSSGTYSGTLNNIPYNYNVLLCNKNNQRFTVIELISTDMIFDTLKIPSIMNFYTNFDATIRQAVFGISSSASNIYDILEATESYNEVGIVNMQMRDCYKILKAIMNPNETLKYIYNVMDIKVCNLSKFMAEVQSTIDKILIEKRTCIIIEAEEDLYINVDEDRFTYILVNTILHIISHTEGVPFIKVIAKKVAGDILVSISNGDYNRDIISEDFYSYAQVNSNMLINNPYVSSAPDLYLIKLFCNRFDGKLYVVSGNPGENAVGIRLPSASEEDILSCQQELKSESAKYNLNKFSPFHIGLANVYNYDFFK